MIDINYRDRCDRVPGWGNGLPKVLATTVIEHQFFNGLDWSQLALLAELSMEIEFETGSYLFRQGDPANRFYVIVEGAVELESADLDRAVTPPQRLGAGDYLGLSWLIPPHYFQISAIAAKPTRVLFFYGSRLKQLCEDDHDFGYELLKRIGEGVIRLCDTIQKDRAECGRRSILRHED